MPAWIRHYDRETLPVQVVGGKGPWNTVEVFANLEEARKVYPMLEPDINTQQFTWAMRGEIKGQPAMRFESWEAERHLSM